MIHSTISSQNPALDEVKQKFAQWRKTRKRGVRIPEELWEASIKVFHTEGLSLHKIARALRLNQTDLKNRIQQESPIVKETSSPAFIEVNCVSRPDFNSECIVEMEDSRGSKMKMYFKGKTDFDLLELGKSFWSKQV